MGAKFNDDLQKLQQAMAFLDKIIEIQILQRD